MTNEEMTKVLNEAVSQDYMTEARKRAEKYMHTFTNEELKAIVAVHCDYRLGRYVHGNRFNRVDTLLEIAPDLHWLDLLLICHCRHVMYSQRLTCEDVLTFAVIDYPKIVTKDTPEIEIDSMVWEM